MLDNSYIEVIGWNYIILFIIIDIIMSMLSIKFDLLFLNYVVFKFSKTVQNIIIIFMDWL